MNQKMNKTREPDLSINEVAELYDVAARTVRRWIAEGSLPAYRVGPKILRVRAADVADMARRIPTTAA